MRQSSDALLLTRKTILITSRFKQYQYPCHGQAIGTHPRAISTDATRHGDFFTLRLVTTHACHAMHAHIKCHPCHMGWGGHAVQVCIRDSQQTNTERRALTTSEPSVVRTCRSLLAAIHILTRSKVFAPGPLFIYPQRARRSCVPYISSVSSPHRLDVSELQEMRMRKAYHTPAASA
jgi:hypothetical protein